MPGVSVLPIMSGRALPLSSDAVLLESVRPIVSQKHIASAFTGGREPGMKIGNLSIALPSPDKWPMSPQRFDAVLALVVLAVEVVGLYAVASHQPDRRAPDLVAIVLLVLGACLLALRRRYPGWTLVFISTATLLFVVLGYPKGPNFLAMFVAFFTAVTEGRRLIAWVVLSAEYVLFPWLPYVLGREPEPTSAQLVGLAGWLLVQATVAEIAYIRHQRDQRAREEEARRRSGEERLRMARELHDVLGHNISLIHVQAGVALHLMDQQPEQARVALSVIKTTSKDALRELRSVLDVLRQDHEEPPRTPSPGLANLRDLIARTSDAGLHVQTRISGDLHGLPASVDLAAFRIIQEALTNVMRHSGQTTAVLDIRLHAQELVVQIENPGSPNPSRDQSGSRQGILGMHERATALGGIVEAGPRPDKAFRVVARLPLNGRPLRLPGTLE